MLNMSLEDLHTDALDHSQCPAAQRAPALSPTAHRAPALRRRSLTLESHFHPFSGSSLGMKYRQETDDPGYILEPRHLINHSCLAGNLHAARTRRKCFIEYGFLNHALELTITRRFGVHIWEEIRSLSDARVASPFILRMLYDDRMTYSIVQTASEVLGLTVDEIWEMFGETFLEFCEESGYDKILRVLGGTLKEFLENLDALHDHLSSIYPGMRAPSFRCSERENDGALILHYYSERQGLEHVVIGLVKTVARRLHNKEVNVDILTTQSEYCPDHVQFLVTDRTDHDKPQSRRGSGCPLGFPGDQTQEAEDEDDDSWLVSSEPKISPATFCKAFPFHVMFNRDFNIVQAGNSLSRVIQQINDPSCKFTDIFQIIRPQINMSFEDMISHSNSVFVVRVRPRISLLKRHSSCSPYSSFNGLLTVPSLLNEDTDVENRKQMRLKGEMLYVQETDKIVFLCSPSVGNLEELLSAGLYLSDIPAHDSTRDLLFLSEQFRAEYELTQRLEVMTDKLQQTYRELEIEKQLTDKLVYSILPPTVANKLRVNEPVEAVKYHSVTMLFSGICDFNVFCSSNPAMKIVNLLNEIYTKFDALAEPRVYNVYKVETVGDKYMLASGLPERSAVHAKNIAQVALDMMDIARDIVVDGQGVSLTIGIHSGEVVAGVVGQKLPRFAVFGSTVCLASRMESTGLADHINISEATYRCLNDPECYDPQFSFKVRGEVHVKGMLAPMKCYLLSRNLHKLPKVQMLLETGLTMTADCIISPAVSPQGCIGSLEQKSPLFPESRSPGFLKQPPKLKKQSSTFCLPDPTAQTLIRVAANLAQVTTGSLGDRKSAYHSVENINTLSDRTQHHWLAPERSYQAATVDNSDCLSLLRTRSMEHLSVPHK